MKNPNWLRGVAAGKYAKRSRRHVQRVASIVTEPLECRRLLTATGLDASEPIVDPVAQPDSFADPGYPENVDVLHEPGHFEVSVGVPPEVFDVEWPPLLSVNEPPILIDGGGLMPTDELEPDVIETVDFFDLLDFPEPPDLDFDPGQDILVSVGFFGLPIGEMFGGELPDNDALNDFLANGPADDGFLATMLDEAPEGEAAIGLSLISFFTSGPLKQIQLHEDGIEVSASLYELMVAPPFDGPDELFDGGPVFADDISDDAEFEESDDDGMFPDELEVSVHVDGLPREFAPPWLGFFPFALDPEVAQDSVGDLPGTPVLFESDDELDLETDGEPNVPEHVSFESSVPVSELLLQGIFSAVLFAVDSDPDFEVAEPPEDFEPTPDALRFSLGVHLVDFGEPDEDGLLPGLGIEPDYDYSVTLGELLGAKNWLLDDGTDPGETVEDSEEPAAETAGETALTTISVSLQYTDEAEPGTQPTTATPPVPVVEFGAEDAQLVDGTLTVSLPELTDGGWTATASGSDLIFDFESAHGDASDTVSLTGVTTLIINGSQVDDFIDLDLTDLDAPELDAIALHGGEGNDGLSLIGAEQDRFSELLLTGGRGDDFITVGLTHAMVILRGGDGDDALFGGQGKDEMHGGAGDDLLDGGGGRDQIYGGRGDDVILGGGGHDSMWGGAGDDHIVGHSGRDRAFGGSGADTLMGGRGNDRGFGGSGDDRIDGGAGRDTLKGGGGNDGLRGRSGNDRLFGGDGHDTLEGSSGRDIMKGGRGDDNLLGGKGNDRMFGGRGKDRMFGSRGRDRLEGGEDADSVFGNDGDDTLAGIRADDVYDTGRGLDLLFLDNVDLDELVIPDDPSGPPPIFLGPPDVMPADDVPDNPAADPEDVDAGFEDFDDVVDEI